VSAVEEVGRQDAGAWEAEGLVSEGLDAPALYRGLSTEYADVGRLVEFLGVRLFSGLVRVILPGREAHVLLFRGKPQAARYNVEGRRLESAEALRELLADSRWMEGEIWVHELPEELFPDSWEEREPIAWEEMHPRPLREELEPAAPAEEPEPAAVAVEPEPPAPALDLVTWVKLLEAVVARFRRYWGPSAAARLEGEVGGALQAGGLRLRRGRLEGQPANPEVLRAAFVRAVEVVRGMAGGTFADQSVASALREAGLRDEPAVRAALGLD
jgi:hypothetical protein